MNEEKVATLFARLTELNRELAAKELEAMSVKSQLQALIPGNTAVAGVQHLVRPHTSVSYKEIFNTVNEKFVPKTKADAVAKIVAKNTKVTESHTIKAAD